MLNAIIHKTCEKRPKNRNSQVFKKLNFVDINIEKIAGTNFAIAVTKTLYF